VLELSKEVHVPMKGMHHLRVCLDAAADGKTHLDRVAAKAAVPVVLTGEGAVATANMVDVTRGLASFQLVPVGRHLKPTLRTRRCSRGRTSSRTWCTSHAAKHTLESPTCRART